MSKKYIIAILGGDRRQAIIAKRLLSRGHTVRIFGLDAPSAEISGAECNNSADKAILGCDIILLPLPVSRDNFSLNLLSIDEHKKLNLEDIVKLASKNQDSIIVGGMIPCSMREYACEQHVKIFDYYASEDLQIKNALPSAEGAIMVAMENTYRVIQGMPVLIIGYGRIGRLLAEKLKALGADIVVAARRDEVLCEIVMSGYNAICTSDTERLIIAAKKSVVIFNTVPHIIFKSNMLEFGKEKPLYIEIASSPGGIDVSAARQKDIRMIFAPSLPGKYAPVNAGEYIYETVYDILEQEGVKL